MSTTWKRYSKIFAAAGAAAAILIGAGNAFAASPDNGTVTPSSPSLTYSGGPFAFDNQTGTAGNGTTPTCAADVSPCDDFALTVAIPTTDPSGYQVRVTVGWANSSSDFDLFVFDSSGNEVGESPTSADPEMVSFVTYPHQTTGYTIRVVPFATDHSTDVYTTRVDLVPITLPPPSPPPVAPPPPSPGIPRYQNFAPPAGSGLGQNAGEPSIGVNWKTGNVMFQSDVQTLRVSFAETCFAYVKSLWENRSAANEVIDSDPILFTDHQTGRTIEGMLFLLTGRNESSFSDNDGDLWVPSEGSSITSGVDHETVGGGPFAPPLTRDPNGPVYPNAVYYCSQDIETALCAVSPDGGATYGPAVPIYTIQDCGGLHGHVKVAPDGTAYVPNKNCGNHQALVYSTDNGASWAISAVPDSTPGGSDPTVGIGAGGTLYFGYQAQDGHPMASVGRFDGSGISWQPSRDVGTSFRVKNTVFPAAVAGDDDRAAIAFFGTPEAGAFQDQSFRGIWHLYVAHTYDSGQSWTTVDATPDDSVQRGCVWLQGGLVTCRNLLDFIDATVDSRGRVLIGYADGCVGPCVHLATEATGNSFSALASIARQSGGLRLFRQFDPSEPTLPGAATVTAERDSSGVHVFWTEPDSGGSPITGYRIYRRGEGESAATLIASTDGVARSYLDSTAAGDSGYFYSVSGVNSLGESPSCGIAESEVAPTDIVGDRCRLPGLQAAADAAGDQTGAPLNNDLDILSLSVAEPFDAANPNGDVLVVTMKVNADVSAPLPDRQWRIIWNYPNGPNLPGVIFDGVYYVGMSTDDTGAVSFEWGTVEEGVIGLVLGNPTPHRVGELSGIHLADGTIRITVPRSLVGHPAVGDLLGALQGRTFDGAGSTTFRSTGTVDSTAPAGYLVAGNLACAPRGTSNCFEDDAAQIAYGAGWHHVSDSDASAGHFAVTASNGRNNGVSLTFDVPSGQTGAVTYFYATSPKGGSAEVVLDGKSTGTIQFAGSSGTMNAPAFGSKARYESLAAGRHTLELRNVSGVAYIDGFCIESGSSDATPANGPGSTASSTNVLTPAQELVHNVSVPPGAMDLSVLLSTSGGLPVKLVIVDPAGHVLTTATTSGGIAAVDVPTEKPGLYLIKTINVNLGPVTAWTAVTPWGAR